LEEARAFRYFMSPIFKGHYPQIALDWLSQQGALPETEPGDMAIISTPIDFLGVNCYSVNRVSSDPSLVDRENDKQAHPEAFTAVDWEIYPQALYEAVMTVKRDFSGDLPLYVTENGAAFDDEVSVDGGGGQSVSFGHGVSAGHETSVGGTFVHDPRRVAFLRGYLAELHRAIQDGADVRGYYAWSLMDNFEWSSGYSKRFGLLYTDYATQRRIWKDSAYWYADAIRKNGFEV
jgi:beta-glucosidase